MAIILEVEAVSVKSMEHPLDFLKAAADLWDLYESKRVWIHRDLPIEGFNRAPLLGSKGTS